MIWIKSALLFCALAALSVDGTSLQADMITSSSAPIAATDAGGDYSLPETTSFSLPEFNPALGTLTGVEVDVTLTYQGEVGVINFSEYSDPPTGVTEPFTNAMSSVAIAMSAPSGNVPLVSAAYSVASGSVGGGDSASYLGGDTTTTVPFAESPANFGLYEGFGSNTYGILYTPPGSYSGMGTYVGFSGDANSYGSATVTYTYTPTPEPSSVVLTALGAVGLLGLGWRRARRS